MKIPCNNDLISDQMIALGLSERDVIARTLMPTYAFRQIRQKGVIDQHITLGQVHKLVSHLGITIPQLLDARAEEHHLREPRENSESEVEESTTADVAYILSLLIGLPRLVSIPFVARTIGWERPRLDRALDAAPGALEGTGLKLHTSKDFVKVVPEHTPDKALRQTMARLQVASKGLNTREASTLRRIVGGEHVLYRNISTQDRFTLGALKNLGCIELDSQGRYQPTSELRTALPDLA